ncbi:MAG: DUF3604 domain-containing protein [Planctomycetota bacterium]|jgi:hypothetical protein
MNTHVKHKYLTRLSVAMVLVIALGCVRGYRTTSNNTPGGPVVSMVERKSARKYKDLGTATLTGPKTAEVLSYQTWTIVYTAGKTGIRPGGGIRIALRHMNHLWSTVQNEDPNSPGYLSTRSSNDIPISVSVECNNWSKRFMGPYFPWQNIVEVIVGEPGLKAGQTMEIIYGDKSGGSPGLKVQPFDEPSYVFKLYVDPFGKGEYLPLANNPAVEIVAAEARKLTVLMPSDAVVGKPTWCIVRAEDRFGNPAAGYRGTIRFESTDSSAQLPEHYTFIQQDRGVHRFESIVFNEKGFQTVTAGSTSFTDRSNPVKVLQNRPTSLLFWGDLHGHTLQSDGRGTVEQYYDFARHVAALDFCAVSDHAFEMSEEMWAHSKAVTNRVNSPGRFVTFNAYEWSGTANVGGDHNIYWLDDDPPIYRSNTAYNQLNLQLYHGPEPKVGHIEQLFAILQDRLRDKNVFCIPHRGGRAGNPKWHNPKVQRLVEIYSEHFRSEPWAAGFLKKGHRVGIMASSDNHYGNPGYGYLKRGRNNGSTFEPEEVGMGLIAVYAGRLTRKSIFTALYDRHCYATSGDRIILEFTADGKIMGSEFDSMASPVFAVKAVGTDDITRVKIKKNGRIVFTAEPDSRHFELSWRDEEFDQSQTSCYCVRIIQANNEAAVSSPIWTN